MGRTNADGYEQNELQAPNCSIRSKPPVSNREKLFPLQEEAEQEEDAEQEEEEAEQGRAGPVWPSLVLRRLGIRTIIKNVLVARMG